MFAIHRALKLNNSEATLMSKHAGFCRVVYNMGLSLRTQMYGETKLSDAKVIAGIKKVLTNHVKKNPKFAWMNELSSKVYQSALASLQTAFTRYRQGLAKHPVFASRKDGQSFTVYDGNGKVVVSAGSTIKIPTLGTFRLHEPLTEGYVTQTFTISRQGSRWYVSFGVDAMRLPVNHLTNAVGIDVGVKTFATLSDEQVFDAPKPLKQVKTKLAQLQRKASRQVKGSANQRKTYDKICGLHARVGSIHRDFLHKLTTYLAKTFKVVKIENLNVKGMMANHKLAGAIAPVHQLLATGSGAHSVWLQILADVLNIELIASKAEEGAAYGAAILAMVGVGAYPDVESTFKLLPPDSKTVQFQAKDSVYEAAFQRYQSLYEALKAVR